MLLLAIADGRWRALSSPCCRFHFTFRLFAIAAAQWYVIFVISFDMLILSLASRLFTFFFFSPVSPRCCLFTAAQIGHATYGVVALRHVSVSIFYMIFSLLRLRHCFSVSSCHAASHTRTLPDIVAAFSVISLSAGIDVSLLRCRWFSATYSFARLNVICLLATITLCFRLYTFRFFTPYYSIIA